MSYITIEFTSGNWYPDYEYRPASTQNIAGHVLYRQWYISGASPVEGSSTHDIKVTSDAATWSDADASGTPNTFIDNGTTITIKNVNNFVNQTLGVFTKPSTLVAGSTSSSGSTSSGTQKKVFCNFW